MFDTLEPSSLPPEDEALRSRVRALAEAATAARPADVRARSWQGFDADFSRKLGAAGLLGLTLPKAYGGGERGPFARFVVVEELLSAGAPVAAHWIADRQSAPLILNYGTEAQRQFYLPRICRGELFFCIGMSEPGSGSDLASVRTRAERTAGGWRVNGQKIWTTGAMHCDYMIALLRTSGSAEDRHAGLSQLIIDLKAPGITIRPIVDLTGDAHFCEIFFEDVDLPADALIGAEGEGGSRSPPNSPSNAAAPSVSIRASCFWMPGCGICSISDATIRRCARWWGFHRAARDAARDVDRLHRAPCGGRKPGGRGIAGQGSGDGVRTAASGRDRRRPCRASR